MKLIDCTLRDGGYYTNWQFSENLVSKYLSAMEEIKVDYVEIGFRFFSNEGFKGAYAHTSDCFLNELSIPDGLKNKIGVMVNASDFLSDSNDRKQVLTKLNQLFKEKIESKVSLVRVATHYQDFPNCKLIVNHLISLGYKVGLNIMQANANGISLIGNEIKSFDNSSLEFLYLADSYGSLKPSDISDLITETRKYWSGNLGIHAHDSMGNAVNNSLIAFELGVNWIDSTVTGMGRGPGNAQTEYLVIESERLRKVNLYSSSLPSLIDNFFIGLKKKYDWGMNNYYYLAAKYNVHPSYIQNMISDPRYSSEDILQTIKYFYEHGKGQVFSETEIETAGIQINQTNNGSWNPKDYMNGKEVLIIGPGSSVIEHKFAIESYILRLNPFVIALNTSETINEDLIDIRSACHPLRIIAEISNYSNFQQPFVIPKSLIDEASIKKINNLQIFDYGMNINNEGKFTYNSTNCSIPKPIVLAYSLAIASSAQAIKVTLAGFDGYGSDNKKRKEIDNLLEQYCNSDGSLEIISITDTSYEIPVKSVYGFLT